MTCPNCKKEISTESKFCKYCGTEIATKETPSSDNRPKTEAKPGALDQIIRVASIVAGIALGRYLGLAILFFAAALFIGIWFADWYMKRQKINITLVKWIVWSNLVTWFLPPLGILTGFATLTFSNYFPGDQKKYKVLAIIGIGAAIINAFIGILNSI